MTGASVPPEFKVSPVEGVLDAKASCFVNVDFTAGEPAVFNFDLKFEISDLDGLSGVAQTLNVNVSAESYRIDVAVFYFIFLLLLYVVMPLLSLTTNAFFAVEWH